MNCCECVCVLKSECVVIDLTSRDNLCAYSDSYTNLGIDFDINHLQLEENIVMSCYGCVCVGVCVCDH